MNSGAKKVYCYATHGLFSGKAIDLIDKSEIDKIIITNSIPLAPEKKSKKIEVLSVGTLLAEVIRRIDMNVSLTTVINHNFISYFNLFL